MQQCQCLFNRQTQYNWINFSGFDSEDTPGLNNVNLAQYNFNAHMPWVIYIIPQAQINYRLKRI